MRRTVEIGHRLTGWNAIRGRSQELGLTLSDDQIKEATTRIKSLADQKPLSVDDVDALLRAWPPVPEIA